MGKQYRSREGENATVDSKTALTTLGPDSAPGALNVPTGATKLLGVYVSAAGNGAATGSATTFFRLEGSGLKEGPEIIAGPAQGGSVATGQALVIPATYVPLDAEVVPGNEILVFVEFCGADIGAVSFGITLVFG